MEEITSNKLLKTQIKATFHQVQLFSLFFFQSYVCDVDFKLSKTVFNSLKLLRIATKDKTSEAALCKHAVIGKWEVEKSKKI